MKYVFIDSASVDEVINSRKYQSTEFEEGKALVAFLRGQLPRHKVSQTCVALNYSDGGFMCVPSVLAENFVVFDFEEMQSLLGIDDVALLVAIQKTLRFCKKLWSGLTPSKHERVISDGKAVVFPYPIGMQTSLRITIDRTPDAKRRTKRESGQAYLVYKFSDNEGDGPTEASRLTNFRKASEARENARGEALSFLSKVNVTDAPALISLAVTQLGAEKSVQFHDTGLENWRRWLTSSQLRFVESSLTAPHRIEGPAGTGKTLCLVLKSLKQLTESQREGTPLRALFVTHSQATKTAIENLFATNGGECFLADGRNILTSSQSVSVTTLQELCSALLHQEISDVELVDRDAYESKLTQKLYAIEAVERAISRELESHRAFLSSEFLLFLEQSDRWAIAEMLQHEISVQIKGRAEQDLVKYQKLPPLKFGLPASGDGDRAFVFLMYEEYQRELEEAAQFDTDDVVLSAISQLGTPIWRRRRVREGYDSIYIDETHLFNLNELSIFHKLTRGEVSQPIAYSVDRSQALGDRGWTSEAFEDAFSPSGGGNLGTEDVRSIFRCSPEIIDLAFSVTSSGATLFTNFHNPLISAVSAFSAEEERKCCRPFYRMYPNDETMFADSFNRAESMAREMNCARAEVAIIAFGDDVFRDLQVLAEKGRKPLEVIKSRGDLEAVNRAKQSGRYVLSAPEFVGGLEFSAVILVGVDGGRVPQASSGSGESQAFLDYAAHQRLYVSITRAKYRVEMLGTRVRGLSSALKSAHHSGLIELVEDS